MSTPDQPEPPLTRRRLRELRNTGVTPIITPEMQAAPVEDAAEPHAATVEAEIVDTAEGQIVDAAPADQETASSRDATGAHAESDAGDSAPHDGTDDADDEEHEIELVEIVTDDGTPAHEVAEEQDRVQPSSDDASVPHAVTDELDGPVLTRRQARERARLRTASVDVVTKPSPDDEGEAPAVVGPGFGSGLLAGEGVEVELPASFDQVLARGGNTTGSIAVANALILSQTPEADAFAPITATGEVLMTGSLLLPDSFGATGTVPGAADGKDVDAVLIDGELPATSSPTPIAASSAISTIKSAEDVIKPPAPDKGSRLMLALVITAGALALALTGVLIVALFTGAFG